MRVHAELTDPDSCLNRGAMAEMAFVLLGRDASAPVAIEAWIADRLATGKNGPADPLIAEARECAATMRAERRRLRSVLGKAD